MARCEAGEIKKEHVKEIEIKETGDKKKAFPQGNLVLCDGSTCYGSDSGIDCNGIYE